MRIGLGLATASMAAMLMVTASFAADETPQVGKAAEDPMEGINRITSGFNRVVRGAIVDPLVDGYQAVTPQFLQDAIGNAAANLNEPVTAVSSFLQGDTDNAEAATKRFFINSTLGLGGLEDKATEMGYESRQEDLGQAAGYHGTDAGTHIVLPLLGPSNTRDLVGDVLTGLASPVPLVG
jgi:phospholipid-binding lipoprotein MlaA